MPGTSEAFSRVNTGAQLKGQPAEALRKAEAVFQSVLASTLDSNQVTEDATKEADFA